MTNGKKVSFREGVRRSAPLYLLMLPAVIIFLLFTYYPMYGIIIAFKDYKPSLGILGSPWVGFKNFETFFHSYQFVPTIRNTVVISLYTILVTFPLPIFLALMCNQMKALKFKKFFQVSTYLPHFISTVVMCGMIILFLSPSTGIIAKIVGLFGVKMPNLMGMPSAFPHIYVWTEAWQHVGWDSILYIATLSSVDPTLYEAATMDGANKWQKMLHVDDFEDLHADMFVLSLHVELMNDAGLIEVFDSNVEPDGFKDFTISRLTLSGYEYLDAIRNRKVWMRVKKKIEFLGGATLDIIKQLAVKELAKELGL